MGEAKRRSQLDPNYGQFFNLSSVATKNQHSQLVIGELFAAFVPEFKILIRAKTFPDDYQQICTRVTNWIECRLLRYRQEDRTHIAQFILGMIAQLDDYLVIDQYQQKDEVSPVLLCCLFQATKSYFSDEDLSKMKLRLRKLLDQFTHHHETQFFGQSLLEQIQY